MNLSGILREPKTTVIDVREPFEFASGHVPGALNIPLGQIPYRVHEFKEMSQPLVMYCRSGGRSGQATAFLRSQGITEVYNGGSVDEVLRAMPKVA